MVEVAIAKVLRYSKLRGVFCLSLRFTDSFENVSNSKSTGQGETSENGTYDTDLFIQGSRGVLKSPQKSYF